ncbi:amidase signature enzyme [Myriangium duriaei CBS 260.36]|uniref:Amidase signature enzyme n=1 Tax=Myriangium duriaei CBS 260.36 TaxID=1168546 RepID=A0A9P4IWA6_9PEZI|nr:amidase signature enzyme [Myriangium duriaei CBS 260.36]
MQPLTNLLHGMTAFLMLQSPIQPNFHPAFDATEATVASIRHALMTGQTTCHHIVATHLARIAALNPAINAIISLDPDALQTADRLDAQLAADGALPPLFCVPVLVKDNFDTTSLPTTGACAALADSRPSRDAPTVAALREAGAVLLGKTNMHELALEGLSVSSHGGQTFNPYDLSRTPGGSSGGSGAAVAAGLAVLGTCTDTVNSCRSPASGNALVSVRGTRGLVSRAGVMPVSYTQDVVGMMGRRVEDVAVALTVMKRCGYDDRDNATALAPPSSRAVDYTVGLMGGRLRGKRIGWLTGFFNLTKSAETDPVNDAMERMRVQLENAGVEFVEVSDHMFDAVELLRTIDTQRFEYRQLMDEYLADPFLGGKHPTSLSELYSCKYADYLAIPAQWDHVKDALASSTDNRTTDMRPSYAAVKQRVANVTLALHQTFAAHRLDAVMYPQQRNLVVRVGAASQSGRNGILAAVTGFPVVAMPAGFSPRSKSAPEGIPIGMELLGLPWAEETLLQMAYQIESLTRIRRTPALAKRVIEPPALERVPDIVPDRSTIDIAYPLGRLDSCADMCSGDK